MPLPDAVVDGFELVREIELMRCEFRPGTLALEVNDVCGRRCRHCTFGGWRLSGKESLTASEWREVLRQAAAIGTSVVTFSAREPFHPSTAELASSLVAFSRKCGFSTIGAVSDAAFVPSCREALLGRATRLDYLDVSIDGMGDYHDYIRGSGAWEVLNSCFNPVHLREAVGALCGSVTLTHGAVPTLLQTLRWIRDRGGRAATVALVYGSRWTDKDLLLKEGDVLRALEQMGIFREETDESFGVVCDLTPFSVPDICDVVEAGVISFENLMVDESGSTYINTDYGVPMRVYGGIIGVGSSYRISPDGSLRLEYTSSECAPPDRTWGNVRDNSLRELLEEGLFGARGVWRSLLQRATALSSEIVECPAWPYHMERCARTGQRPNQAERAEV